MNIFRLIRAYKMLEAEEVKQKKFDELQAEPLNYDIRYRDWETDRKSTRLNSSHRSLSRMPSSA